MVINRLLLIFSRDKRVVFHFALFQIRTSGCCRSFKRNWLHHSSTQSEDRYIKEVSSGNIEKLKIKVSLDSKHEADAVVSENDDREEEEEK